MHRKSWWLGFPFILSVVLMLLNISYVQAGGELLSGSGPRELNFQIHKGGCYTCHVDSNLTGSFDDGETIYRVLGLENIVRDEQDRDPLPAELPDLLPQQASA